MHTNISASPSIPSCGRDYFNFAQPALAMAYSDYSDFMRMLSDLTDDLSEIRLFEDKSGFKSALIDDQTRHRFTSAITSTPRFSQSLTTQ